MPSGTDPEGLGELGEEFCLSCSHAFDDDVVKSDFFGFG